MRRYSAFALCLIFTAGLACAHRDEPVATAVYVNPEGKTISAVFHSGGKGGKVVVRMTDGREITLPLAISASGARYSDGKVTFWEHQDKATVSEGNTVLFEGDLQIHLPRR
jgi:membrane-bound inhibitor of C-type lysozyme